MSKANSVRTWPCTTCNAKAGEPCRARTTGRITDTHSARLNFTGRAMTPTQHPEPAEVVGLVEAVHTAVQSVYARHDHTLPLNHVNCVEWTDAVMDALDPALRALVAGERAAALRQAAEEVHREGRWSLEQVMRGKPQNAVGRLIVVEQILWDQAQRETP